MLHSVQPSSRLRFEIGSKTIETCRIVQYMILDYINYGLRSLVTIDVVLWKFLMILTYYFVDFTDVSRMEGSEKRNAVVLFLGLRTYASSSWSDR